MLGAVRALWMSNLVRAIVALAALVLIVLLARGAYLWFVGERRPHPFDVVEVRDGGRELVLQYWTIWAQYGDGLDIRESDDEVAITVYIRKRTRGGGDCPAIATPHFVEAALEQPLGNRVVIDTSTSDPAPTTTPDFTPSDHPSG